MGYRGLAVNVRFRSFVPADLHTVRQHMPFSISESTAGMVAYDLDTQETLAIFIAQEFTPTSCMIHQLILKPMVLRPKYKLLWNVGEWLFGKANLLKIYGLVPEHNWKARQMNEKMGFREICILEEAYNHGVDYILMEMRRDECAYWQEQEMELEKVANG